MKSVATPTRLKLQNLVGLDNLNDEMYRKQDMARTHDPRRPSTRVDLLQDSSRARLNKPDRRPSAGANINQGQEPRVGVARRIRAGFDKIASSQPVKTPSTDAHATTSLLQHSDNSTVLYKKRCGVTLKLRMVPEISQITNEVFENLLKDNPNFDLSQCLVMEDCGNISGKLTQERNAKSIVQGESAFDESEVEVIEDTPCCSNDRKERVKTNKKESDTIINEEIVTSDETAIDALFPQQVNQNNTENVISSTFAKKINETSLEDSDDDCIIVEDHFTEEELSVNNLAFDADIVDCVNSVIDKVCNDLNKYAELLTEQERHIDNLRFPKNIDDNSNISSDILKRSKDKLKSHKDTSYEHNAEGTKKATPKFKQSKKVATIMKYGNNAAKMIDIGKSNVLVESANSSSPLNFIKATLTPKKRKLYSPKAYENDNKEIITPKTRVERRQSNVNQTPIATCYRDLENASKSHSRISKKSRAVTQTKKRKKSRYSANSDGKDPTFEIRKRSSSVTPITTMMSKRDRLITPVKYLEKNYYSEYYSSEDEDKRAHKSERLKQAKSSRNTNKIPKLNFIDEKMRAAEQETLETSFVKETVNVNNIEYPKPALQKTPVLKDVPLNKLNVAAREPVLLENKTQTSKKLNISRRRRNCTPTAASKEKLGQMMETLHTTLAEINRDTSERLSATFSKYQEDINCLKEQTQKIQIRLQEKLEELTKNQMERACEVIRVDAEMKARVVKLLQEDIRHLLN